MFFNNCLLGINFQVYNVFFRNPYLKHKNIRIWFIQNSGCFPPLVFLKFQHSCFQPAMAHAVAASARAPVPSPSFKRARARQRKASKTSRWATKPP